MRSGSVFWVTGPEVENKILMGTFDYKFTVTVNAFLRTALIQTTDANKKEHSINQTFDSTDEWNAFEIGSDTFDIHYHYDEEFTASIYPVSENGIADTVKSLTTELIIKIKD